MSSKLFFIIFDSAANSIGLGYPIWRSYKVLEAKKFDNELIQWLTFWIVVSCLCKAEELLLIVTVDLRGYFVYDLARLLFVAWMIHPKYQGALFLYFNTIEQLFHNNEQAIKTSAINFLEVVPSYIKTQVTRALMVIKKRKPKHEKSHAVEQHPTTPTSQPSSVLLAHSNSSTSKPNDSRAKAASADKSEKKTTLTGGTDNSNIN